MIGKCFCPSSSEFLLSSYMWLLCEMDIHLVPVLQIESQNMEKISNCLGLSGCRIRKWWWGLWVATQKTCLDSGNVAQKIAFRKLWVPSPATRKLTW